MPPKATKKATADVEALLSSLDDLSTSASPAPAEAGAASTSGSANGGGGEAATAATSGKAAGDAQSLLDDLDDLVQRRAATPRRTASSAIPAPSAADSNTAPAASSSSPPSSNPSTSVQEPSAQAASAQVQSGAGAGGGGWGWSSAWSSATKLADQARAEIERRTRESEQARELQARTWGIAQGVRGFVKDAGLEKFGEDLTAASRRGWVDIINAVAPPIAAHEVIQVTLSHDMVGYDGISDVVFRVLQKVMEAQVDQQGGGAGTEHQLVVNKAPERRKGSAEAARPKDGAGEGERDFNAAPGWEAGGKLAETSLAQLIAAHVVEAPSTSALTVPITNCPVFVRIQAVLAPLPGLVASIGNGKARQTDTSAAAAAGDAESEEQLYFLILLRDTNNGLSHRTVSQAVPRSWLDVPFEQNAWVEQALVDVIQGALSIIGQDYVNGRMTGRAKAKSQEAEHAAAAEAAKAQ